jgi:Kdo2-lipid IVA lauroyltransferase/acyltransferase
MSSSAAAGSSSDLAVARRRSPLRDALEFAAAATVIGTLRFSPAPLARRLAHGYARLLDLALPRLRRIAYRNLELTGFAAGEPERQKQIVDGVFRSIGRLLETVARFPSRNAQNISEWIRYEGFEHFEAAKKRGHGVLFATAHLGNWELSAFAHAMMAAEPMHVVVRALDNRRIDGLVEARRALSGNHVIEKTEAARPLLRALAANQAVGILVDQNSNLNEGVFVDFFGLPACANTAIAKLAARTGATVIPGFALWRDDEHRYVLHFYPPVEITGDAAADTARIQAALERAIREYPDQWLWIHRRWKTRPPGHPPLY